MAKVNGSEPTSAPDCMRFIEDGCRGEFYIEFDMNEAVYIDLAQRLGYPVNAALIKTLVWRHAMSICNGHMTYTKEQRRTKTRRTVEPVPDWMIDHLPPGPLAGKQIK